MSKRACNDTGLTPDALVFIDDDPLILDVSMAGFGWAYLCTEGLFAILATHREVEADVFPFHHLDARATGVTGSAVKDRTDHLALPTPRALLMIHDQYLSVHSVLLPKVVNSKHETRNEF